MKLHSIEVIDHDDVSSAKELEKYGFAKKEQFKENEFYNRKFIETAIYLIDNDLSTPAKEKERSYLN